MSGGLAVPYMSNSQLVEVEKIKTKKAADNEKEKDSLELDTGLGAYIRRQWERNRRAKHEINYRLLFCLRARKGEYSVIEMQKILAYGAADPVYLKLTGTKSRAASSWIRDIILSPKEEEIPWDIVPGTIPHLPDHLEKGIAETHLPQALQQLAMQGVTLGEEEMWQFKEQIKEAMMHEMNKIANKACDNLKIKVKDTLEKGNWKEALEDFIEDFVTYPFAVIKGPYYQKKHTLEWKDGKAVPKIDTHLCYRRVSPFDIFCSPYAKTIQEGNLIERLRYSQDTLYQLIGVPGYREDHIRSVLELHKYGNLRDWIWEDFERDFLENNSPYFLSDRDTIDGLHFWGYVQGRDLLTWGTTDKSVKDEQAMYPVEAILVGKHIIRCELNDNPMHWRPYHSATWDKVPGSLVGVSLPEQMEDHQRIVNATCRSLMSNLSIGSGPQAVVLTDMLADGENITNIFPMKIWQMKSSITGNSGKPVEFFQPETNAEELMQIINTFEQKADDVTNVPRYSYGNEKVGGAGQTATGLSMLMNSAAKGIRRAIGNIDSGVIRPAITQTFTQILESDPDPTIQGDINVVADGSASVLIREQLQNNQKEFFQIASQSPIAMQVLGFKGTAKLITDIAEEMGLDDLDLPTDQELDQMDQQQKQQQQQMHEAQVADLNGTADAQSQNNQSQGQQQLQQAMMKIQDQEHQLQITESMQAQKERELQAEQQQAQMKMQLAKKQSTVVETEMKKLELIRREVENTMREVTKQRYEYQSDIERNKVQTDLDHQHKLAELEKAKMNLEMAGHKVHSTVAKAKTDAANKSEDGSDSKSDSKVDAVAQEALRVVAESMKMLASPKKIDIQRDSEGKITGGIATPTKSE